VAVEKVEGVQEAKFSYKLGEGSVTYDPEVTNPEEIIGQLHRLTAYRATLRETDSPEQDDGNGN
jgi:copper chaperone CopZ